MKKAYSHAQRLTAIFNSNITRHNALRRINDWMKKIKTKNIKGFSTFVKTLEKHKNCIANYFISRKNSGFVEGVNNKIKVAKRRCYGLTNIVTFFQRLALDFNGYNMFPL